MTRSAPKHLVAALKTKKMKCFLSGFYFVCLFVPCLQPGAIGAPSLYIAKNQAISDSVPRMQTNYKVITNKDHSYGYDIYTNGKLRVHQPTVPGRQGLKGFTRKGDAKKVAGLVIKKITQGLMPPTIEAKELDSLKIKY
jgi:hypothetical protein